MEVIIKIIALNDVYDHSIDNHSMSRQRESQDGAGRQPSQMMYGSDSTIWLLGFND